MEAVFGGFYADGRWGGNDDWGSSAEARNEFERFLRRFLAAFRVSSVADLGCGLRAGASVLDSTDCSYVGYDCVEEVIRSNRASSPHGRFVHADFSLDPDAVATAELFVIKDVLQHWGNGEIDRLLDALADRPGARFILICNCSNQDPEGADIETGQWRPLDANLEPLRSHGAQVVCTYATKQVSLIRIGDGRDGGIPPVIHQTAPSDRSRWPAAWNRCRKSWLANFPSPDYAHLFWDDEDLDWLVRTHRPGIYPLFRGFRRHICRVDLARYVLLHSYGGLYADMDFECRRNFFHILPRDRPSAVESPYKNNEFLQNSLMASPVGHPFWNEVIDEVIRSRDASCPLDIAGPRALSRAYYRSCSGQMHVLPSNLFNPRPEESGAEYARHLLTKVWV